MHIFFTNCKKRLNIFRLRRESPHDNKFHLGKKNYPEGGGIKKNMNFKNIHPCKYICCSVRPDRALGTYWIYLLQCITDPTGINPWRLINISTVVCYWSDRAHGADVLGGLLWLNHRRHLNHGRRLRRPSRLRGTELAIPKILQNIWM